MNGPFLASQRARTSSSITSREIRCSVHHAAPWPWLTRLGAWVGSEDLSEDSSKSRR
jgi:hypothetical protein